MNTNLEIGAGILMLATTLGSYAAMNVFFDERAKNELDNAITESINNEGYKITSVDTDYFDWMKKDSEYFFKFTGSLMNFDNEKIDFFSVIYKVDKETYKDTLASIDRNCRNDEKARSLSSRYLVQTLANQVKKSQLFKVTLNESVAIRGAENVDDFSEIDNTVILGVSKPIVKDETVSYKVIYAQGVKTKKGELGIVTSMVNVVFDKTEELAQNPAKVFSKLNEEPTKIEVLEREYSKLGISECIRFEEDEDIMAL